MRANLPVLTSAAAVAVALVLGVGSLATQTESAPRQAAASVPLSTHQAPADGRRIHYPEGHQPELALPQGRREIVRSILNIEDPLQFGGYVWDDRGVPQGEVWVRVDISAQLISVFREGHEIGSAVILYGAEAKPTPSGAFPVLQKARDHHSRTYDAPMPFMLRLTEDGVAIHASQVRKGFATHGCIGVPRAFAERLFAEMQLGDLVFIEA